MIPASELRRKERELYELLRHGDPVSIKVLCDKMGYDDDDYGYQAFHSQLSELRKKIRKYGLLVNPTYPNGRTAHYQMTRRLDNNE